MRQIFSSPRIENVRLLERLLEDHGVETRVTGLAEWKRPKSREFSYSDRDRRQPWPVLWVVKAEDYPRARQLLRDEGVQIDTTRTTGARSSFLDDAGAPPISALGRAAQGGKAASRVRMVLVIVCIAVGVMTFLKHLGIAG
jgi:hypothetical protein